MTNKPAPVTDADEPERWPQECESVTTSWHMSRFLADRNRYREALRLWDDHLPGCSGSPRCECGYAEARALLGEVPDEDHN